MVALLVFLRRHWKAAGLALAGAAFAVYRWWAHRQVAAADARTAKARRQSEIDAGRAAVAEAQAREDLDHAERVDAKTRIAKEIDDAAPTSLDPVARRAALRAWLRSRLASHPPTR